MIELIYNEEGEYTAEEKTLAEPKNVKQIGEPKEFKKIFIEDFVYTFLYQYARVHNGQQKFAVLLGKSERAGGKRHIYIKSSLAVEGICEKQGKYLFTEKTWGQIYQDCEKYFPEQEIMGWFLSRPGFALEKNTVIEETHRTYFSGADKVFFMMEPLEKESVFFGFDGNRFAKQGGYYIYYEKNGPMQGYMIEQNKSRKNERPSEKPDVAIANFRKILKEKQARNVRRKKKAVSYGTKVAVALVLFVGVVALKNQTDKIQVMEQQTSEITVPEPVQQASSDGVIVEELPGNVEEQVDEIEEIIESEPTVEVLPVTEETEEQSEIEEEAPEPVEEVIAETPTYVEYIVQAGDTLAKISRDHYGTDEKVSEICNLNEITDGDYIQAGEIILLP